jgi:uncharacterized membrane protein YhaH (DUF805 family)
MFQILREMWGGWSGERLSPRRFAMLYGATWLFLILIGLLTLVLATTMFGGDGEPLSDAAGRFAGLLALALLLWFAALFNITVKRGRDIGVPGFVAGVLFLALLAVGGVSVFASLLLALVPTDTLSVSRA